MGVKKGTPKNPRDVEEYLSWQSTPHRAALEKLRRTIKSMVPNAVEVISYQIPTFKLNGRMLVSYAAFSEHCSFFPGAGPIDLHQSDLKSFITSKGTIRFTPEKPIPAALLRKLVKTRISLDAAKSKKRESQQRKARTK
jgi:uncharacterized protein YdhG (YjbR/CyaY superfamily)